MGSRSGLSFIRDAAAVLGIASKGREVLYVITGGTAPEPVKVVAIDTRYFYDGETS